MPRLRPGLINRASQENPLLPFILRSCHDLPSARNEYRWLREHVASEHAHLPCQKRSTRLQQLCHERGKGRPLQYLLGSQPFGALDIQCRTGVLIPRWETEAYTSHTAKLIIERWANTKATSQDRLRVLDLCTGTGCIALLLHNLLSPQFPTLEIVGVDISSQAVALAKINKRFNITQGHLRSVAASQVRFDEADLFSVTSLPTGGWDVIISNPPYISPKGFDRTTSRSVRRYEPKAALVPDAKHAAYETGERSHKVDQEIGDMFYGQLMDIALLHKAKMVVLEVADLEQAKRVASRATLTRRWRECQIWRDFPGQRASEVLHIAGSCVPVTGQGNERVVLLKRE